MGYRGRSDQWNNQTANNATAVVITQMLTDLQALNISDPKLTAFTNQWQKYVTNNLN